MCENFSRYEDKENQVAGADVKFTYKDEEYIVDEKASVKYNDLKTFMLELSFINRNNEIQEGWFTLDGQINNAYLLMWFDKFSCISGRVVVFVALVRKDKLNEFMNGKGWTLANLRKKAYRIRYEGDRNFGDLATNECQFGFSENLVERPVYVKLLREKYLELADAFWYAPLPDDICVELEALWKRRKEAKENS